MNKYIDEPRLIFRDTIKNNLIGPGSDVFISIAEEEIISDYPLSRYFSGILFPEKEVEKPEEDTKGNNDDVNANAEIEDSVDDILPLENEDSVSNSEDKESDDSKKAPKDYDHEYSEANQYFPTNFGLTFCVPKETKNIKVTFNFAKYQQLKPINAKIEIEEADYKWFVEHPFNSVSQYLEFENGSMFLNKKSFEKSGLDVRTYRARFKENEQQTELLNSVGYKKVELLLGRLWKREKQEPKSIQLDLNEINVDESKEHSFTEDENGNKKVACYYKKIYETGYGKFIKILLANTEKHPKKKFSFSNELLNKKAIFQGEIIISGATFLPYKQLSETNPFDDELNLINFQYRNEHSFGIGHGCAVTWNYDKNPTELKTTFLPEVDIKNYSNEFKKDFPEELKEITELKKLSIWTELDKTTIIQKLKLFADEYKKWIVAQDKTAENLNYQESLDEIIEKQDQTYTRLVKNIEFLSSNDVAFRSFLISNTATQSSLS
ncbi:hypothetical protein MASR2M47_27910 [Draconibacterium sp.]